MTSSLTTTYFGHCIRIEPCEWGYLAQIVELGTNRRLIAANSSAFQALEDAFCVIDEQLDANAAD